VRRPGITADFDDPAFLVVRGALKALQIGSVKSKRCRHAQPIATHLHLRAIWIVVNDLDFRRDGFDCFLSDAAGGGKFVQSGAITGLEAKPKQDVVRRLVRLNYQPIITRL
jgi:hypothetical protein